MAVFTQVASKTAEAGTSSIIAGAGVLPAGHSAYVAVSVSVPDGSVPAGTISAAVGGAAVVADIDGVEGNVRSWTGYYYNGTGLDIDLTDAVSVDFSDPAGSKTLQAYTVDAEVVIDGGDIGNSDVSYGGPVDLTTAINLDSTLHNVSFAFVVDDGPLSGWFFTPTSANFDHEYAPIGFDESVSNPQPPQTAKMYAWDEDTPLGGDHTLQGTIPGSDAADDFYAVLRRFRLKRPGFAQLPEASGALSISTIPLTSVEVPSIVRLGHVAGYGIVVSASLVASYTASVLGGHAAPYVSTVPVGTAGHSSAYNLGVTEVARQHLAEFSLRVAAGHTAEYTHTALVASGHEASYGASFHVEKGHEAPYALSLLQAVSADHRAYFSYLAEATTSVVNATAILRYRKGGVPYVGSLITFDLSADEGGYAWAGTLELANISDYQRLSVGDDIEVDLFGEVYSLIVESKGIDRSQPADVRLQIHAISPVARLTAPWVLPITKTWIVDTPASAIAEEIASMAGLSADWQTIDWVVKADRLSVTDGDPLQPLLLLAEAAGAVVESMPDGSLLVRDKYPVSPKNYDVAAEDQVFTDEQDNLSTQETLSNLPYYNYLELGDIQPSSELNDRIEFIPDEIDDARGKLRVYPFPWRTEFELINTGPTSVRLSRLGARTMQHEELVEFNDYTGNVEYPIYSLDSIDWIRVSLAPLTIEQYTSRLFCSTSDPYGYSLANVSYTKRYIEYDVSGKIGDIANIIMVEKIDG